MFIMEKIYVLPLQILAVIVTATIIGLAIAWFRKRKKKKLSTSKNTPLPALEERSGFEDGVIS